MSPINKTLCTASPISYVPRLVRGIQESLCLAGSRGQAAGRRYRGWGRALTSLFIIQLLLLATGAKADTTAMLHTKSKLKQLETRISDLQHSLSSAHNKTSLLNKELSETEKKISDGIRQLNNLHLNMADKQRKIAALEKQVNELNKQLQEQQHLLAKHVRARYTMGEYQPLKWLLNQDNPQTMSRLLTFYQYVVQSRLQIIEHVQVTKKNLSISQEQLRHELEEQQQLQLQLSLQQKKLEQNKRYSTAIIRSLNQTIQSNEQALTESQQNKESLSKLLVSLVEQSIVRPQHPFVYMQRRLPRPVNVTNHQMQNMNQGVIFFADEGTPVGAVYPGKVVFSDWLKGYGLLLIIDHGQGFMTLYAHNQSLFKQKGDAVNQGEQIATIGHSGGLKQNGLYFEIRQRGKAIPPLRWLS